MIVVHKCNIMMHNDTDEEDIGTCCFCGGECSPYSQACGACARKCSILV